jgi:7-carboxy-7-deazaguanine synthase
MKRLRYTEEFISLQGEGLFVGVPSVFLRTFGCNFRCKSFGLPRGSADRTKQRYNPEVAELIKQNVHLTAERFEDLPLVHTGCDTYASIYPEFKNLAKDHTVDQVVDRLLSLTPNAKWVQENGQDIHLILTGGEPLLAWQQLYIDLFEHPKMQDLKNVTFETNTTQFLHKDFEDYLANRARFKTTFSCSPKLSISGESWKDAIKPSVARQYYNVPNTNFYFKFVVADAVDIEEVDRAVAEYRSMGIESPVYLMPVGGREEGYELTVRQVADLAKQKGYRFSPRLHISLYGNAWST